MPSPFASYSLAPSAWRCSAPSGGPTIHDRARRLLTIALVLLVFAAALVIRFITPTGAILLSIAIGGVFWQRRAFARA